MLEKGRCETPPEPRDRELTVVSVATQRQVRTALHQRGPEHRVVCERDDEFAGPRARHRSLDVRADAVGRSATPASAGGISGSRDPEARPVPFDWHRIVHEDAQPAALESLSHRIPAGVDVVIAGDREHTMRRRERAEGRDEMLDVAGVVIDLIAGDRDEIRLRLANGTRDALEMPPRRVRADVEIRQLDDTHAIETGG
jgi:hypothetical protein